MQNNHDFLNKVGWNSIWAHRFKEHSTEDLIPGRVMASHRTHYELYTAQGPCRGEVAGKMRYESLYKAKLPVTGDWVGLKQINQEQALIQAILQRESSIERWGIEEDEAQVLAANVDYTLIFQALDREMNLAGLDRLLSMTYEGGAIPLIVLTKSDVLSAEQVAQKEVLLTEAFPEVEIMVTSSLNTWGLDELKKRLESGKTYAALGYSGAGKSTLLNSLLGEERIKTQEVREEDGRGRHTTTARHLYILPGGSLYLDTPGIREIAVFSHASTERAFSDITDLARDCRFSDCTHDEEPGCAVQAALRDGKLDAKRWQSHKKLLKEQRVEDGKRRKLQRKIAKTKIRREKIHYKDFIRGGYEPYED